ncbi:MAG: isoprenyl transferase [Deltaproteobacteria bacterium]|nr:isoprenyl transferase [Deltaproteobacteria bacterium]MBW2120313.1 isoprenyl transferase [Deltaproteobacteria bacterium]
MDPNRLPRHVAIIMDGNGRWAKRKSLSRINGHMKGVDSVRTVVTACREMGIKYLTLYAFSMENWKRPEEEVRALMDLLFQYLMDELEEMLENDIRLNAIGELETLPPRVYGRLMETMKATRHCQGMTLTLALSYGGRAEIIHAVTSIVSALEKKEITREDVGIDSFASHLWTKDLPDPDLLIRTSGEYRISNFLLWQMAYTEIYVTETLWPDFGREELVEAILDYQSRERRFGLTSEQLT